MRLLINEDIICDIYKTCNQAILGEELGYITKWEEKKDCVVLLFIKTTGDIKIIIACYGDNDIKEKRELKILNKVRKSLLKRNIAYYENDSPFPDFENDKIFMQIIDS